MERVEWIMRVVDHVLICLIEIFYERKPKKMLERLEAWDSEEFN